MNWVKLPQIKPEELHIGCCNCSSASLEADMDRPIIAFGEARVERDGKTVYDGSNSDDEENMVFIKDVEEMAINDPDHDWRIVFKHPLHGETYQRHETGKWVCIESNKGFA